MGTRILALAAAIAMVVGAVVVRDRIDNDDDKGRSGAAASGALRLVCANELRAVCEAIEGVEVTVEPAAATAARLKGIDRDKAAIDGWLTPGPWGAMVDSSRTQSAGSLFAKGGEPLARSPFVLAVWKNARSKLNCPDPVNLGCLGDAVITRGFRLGVPADDQAEGVLADAALGAGHIKNDNFATNDLNETDLADWVTAVDVNSDRVGRNPGGRSFTELLTFGPAAADGFLSTDADIGPQYAGAPQRNRLDVVQAVPVANVDVILAVRPDDRGSRVNDIVRAQRVRDLLANNGWRVSGITGSDGLPSAGVLQALRDVTK